MSLAEDPSITVTELPDVPADETFRSVLTAYAAEGYEHGYARGTRDLLSLYPLLIERYLHAHAASVTPAVRQAIRALGLYVEDQVSRRLDEAG
jgi:hypothetical protein